MHCCWWWRCPQPAINWKAIAAHSPGTLIAVYMNLITDINCVGGDLGDLHQCVLPSDGRLTLNIVGVGRKSNWFGFFWFPSRIQSSPSNGNTFHQSSCHCSCHWLVANLSMDFYKTPVSQLLLHKALWLPQRDVFLIRVGFGLGCGKTIEIKVTKNLYFAFLPLILSFYLILVQFSWKYDRRPQFGLN